MEWVETLQFANNLSSVMTLPIIIYVVINRIIIQKRSTGIWNWPRTILLSAFISAFCGHLILFIQKDLYLSILSDRFFAPNAYEIGINTLFDMLVLIFGMIFILYINKRDTFTLVPLFFYIGAMWLYFKLGFHNFHIFFIIGGYISLFFIFQTAISLKDNNVFALGIMYGCILLGLTIPYVVIAILFEMMGWYFGLTIAFEKFQLYKD